MEDPIPSTVVVGASTAEVMEDNLNIYYSPLSQKETEVRDYVKKTYFDTLKSTNWEGVEVQKYRDFVKNKGK